MKILNMDDFAKPDRILTLEGVEHEVRDLSVEEFIEVNQAIRELEDKPVLDHIKHTCEVLSKHIPTIPVARFRAMSIPQITIVAQFVRGELDPQDPQKPADAAAGTEQGK